jgi:hypothetical protein
MRPLIAAAIVLVGTLPTFAEDTKPYKSKDGKFSAKFPGEPKVISQKAGDIPMVITIFEKDNGGYAVIYSDMPAEVVKAAPAAKLLEGGEMGLVNNFKAKVTKSGESKFKSGDKTYPARDIIATKDTLHMRVKIIIAGNRLYQVFVVGSKDMTTGKTADEFFKSFEIKD